MHLNRFDCLFSTYTNGCKTICKIKVHQINLTRIGTSALDMNDDDDVKVSELETGVGETVVLHKRLRSNTPTGVGVEIEIEVATGVAIETETEVATGAEETPIIPNGSGN